ncbi:sugar ABC transporter substrate-binding protein [Planobispora rosea]|uniref:sugar ABC transporter substrate-binding protein n=1 Tax=Planobispora rosea TaxID=35762 RepID=UPI00083AE2BE|nr:substrate-binding domain-containing protein [Planobispora rosea]
MIGRRLAAVVAAAVVAALTAGCGNSTQDDDRARTVGFVVAAQKHNFTQEMSLGFRSGVAAVPGVTALVDGPPITDGPRQATIFEDVATRARGGVSLFTLHPELLARPMSRVGKSGVPLVAVDNAPPPGPQVPLFIGNDNHAMGAALADGIIERLPPDAQGTVIIGSPVPGVPVLDNRAEGMRERFAQRLPLVKVRGPFDTMLDPTANLAAWRGLVRANPDALAFMATGDIDSYNLATIRRETGGPWLAAGFDLDPRSLAAVKAGDLMLMSPEHYLKGALAGRLQAENAMGTRELPQGWLRTDGLLVTVANVDEITRRQQSETNRQQWFQPRVENILSDLDSHLHPLA